MQRETTSLAEANDGMSKKLQLLEQLYQQSEGRMAGTRAGPAFEADLMKPGC